MVVVAAIQVKSIAGVWRPFVSMGWRGGGGGKEGGREGGEMGEEEDKGRGRVK